ncbi:MAG: hypothetical protein AB1921_01090 [Thermodesulfobacteriota bacterium]
MNCIDGVEGVLSRVLQSQCRRFAQGEITAMEYALFARGLIEDSTAFVLENREIGVSPELFSSVLYQMARNSWVAALVSLREKDAGQGTEGEPVPDEGYAEYFFDYLYKNGTYPA